MRYCYEDDAPEPPGYVLLLYAKLIPHRLTMHVEHFLNILVGKGDDISRLTQHADQLIQEDHQLTLAEVHGAVSDLSSDLREGRFWMHQAELHSS